jgi:hypothetical protein
MRTWRGETDVGVCGSGQGGGVLYLSPVPQLHQGLLVEELYEGQAGLRGFRDLQPRIRKGQAQTVEGERHAKGPGGGRTEGREEGDERGRGG